MAHEEEEDVEVKVFPIINQAPPREKPLNQKRPPHDHTGTKRQPLMVADYLVRSSFHSTGDVDVETGGDEHRGGEGQQEEQGEVVHNEIPVGNRAFPSVKIEIRLVGSRQILLDRRGRARAVQVHGDNNLSIVALDFNDNFIGGTTGEYLFRRTLLQFVISVIDPMLNDRSRLRLLL